MKKFVTCIHHQAIIVSSQRHHKYQKVVVRIPDWLEIQHICLLTDDCFAGVNKMWNQAVHTYSMCNHYSLLDRKTSTTCYSAVKARFDCLDWPAIAIVMSGIRQIEARHGSRSSRFKDLWVLSNQYDLSDLTLSMQNLKDLEVLSTCPQRLNPFHAKF